MASTGNLNRRLGSRSIHSAIPFLEAFWKAYKVCHPDFSLYYREDVDLGSCIPVYIYADGGRGLEKTELMVFNWSSAVGYGSGKQRASRRKFGRGRSNHPQVNLIGHSYTNRNHFLWAVMPHKWQRWFEIPCYVGLFRWRPLPELHGRDQSWKPLFSPCGVGIEGGLQVASSCREVYPMVHHLQEIRLWSKQRKTNHWLLLLALPCWSYQLSYYPFEEIHTERPRWLEVIDEFALVEECGLLVRSFPYIAHPAKFYLLDLFHIYLAGFGQDHGASCLVYMLGTIFGGSSVEVQLGSLNLGWKFYKRMHHVTTHTYNFARLVLSFLDGTMTYPTGTWSKASDTANFLEFILYTCDLPVYRKIAHDNMLLYIGASCQALGDCMRCLYNADFLRWLGWNVSQRLVGVDNLWGDPCLFLFSPPITSCNVKSIFPILSATQERSLATRAVDSGSYFLKSYLKMASMALLNQQPLFVFKPKLHYFHHILIEMKLVIEKGGCPVNPLAFSCSVAEYLIGRASRFSRRVASQTCEKRVLQRYLAAVHAVWSAWKKLSSRQHPSNDAQVHQQRVVGEWKRVRQIIGQLPTRWPPTLMNIPNLMKYDEIVDI